MQTTATLVIATAALSIASPATAQDDFAFGFRPGMGLSEVSGAEPSEPGYSTNTAPNPHSEMESYYLQFCDGVGLVKVVGIGETIEEGGHGVSLKARFTRYRDALKAKYGRSLDHDFLHSGSIWNESDEFLMSLRQKERSLSSFWNDEEGSTVPEGIEAIAVIANALSARKGWISVAYEFDGFTACAARAEQSDDDAF